MDILIGLAVVAVIALLVYLAKHHVNPTLPPASDVVTGVVSGVEETINGLRGVFAEELSKVPAMVSAEVARLTDELASAIQRAEAAEAKFAAEQAARQASLDAVKDQVGAVIASIGAQPAETLTAPAPVTAP